VLPGEVAFVLTRERLRLPRNMIAVLSPKRKLAHAGIMVLGGLTIDPAYQGFLLIGLYNCSSTPFPLRPGKKVIAAVFYELAEDELVEFPVAEPTEITDFPDDLVNLIRNYRPIALGGLQEEILETRRELTALKTDIATDKTWRDTFKHDLEELKSVVLETSRNVVRISDNLDKEVTLRTQDDKEIHKRITDMSNMFFGWNLFRLVSVAVILLIVGAGLTVLAERVFSGPPITVAAPSPQVPPSTAPKKQP
jgi:hypothetical protein